MAITQQRRHQIFDNASTPYLDLDRYRHARRKVDRLVLDLHLSAIERDPGEIEKLLPLGLARTGERSAGFCGAGLRVRLLPNDCVLGDIAIELKYLVLRTQGRQPARD